MITQEKLVFLSTDIWEFKRLAKSSHSASVVEPRAFQPRHLIGKPAFGKAETKSWAIQQLF